MEQRDWLIIAVFTFVTVVVWIAADIHHAVVTSQITEVQAQLILPLNPKLDNVTIDIINSRK